MINYQRTAFSDKQNLLENEHTLTQHTCSNYVMKQTTVSSHFNAQQNQKKKKNFDDDTKEFNTLITYKGPGEQDDSMDQRISSSDTEDEGFQKTMKPKKVNKLPEALKTLEFQTFSIPSST